MFKKSLVGSQLPVHSNQYYITVKFLKKLANGDKVKLHQLICLLGTIFALADKDENDIEKFKHELTTIPKALAETPELLHEAQKSTLADAIWSTANLNASSAPDGSPTQDSLVTWLYL